MSHTRNHFAKCQSFILAFIAAALVAGCGGGNGTPNSTTTTTPPPTTALANSLQLLAGSATIDSSGSTTVGLTAVVLDTNNNQLSNQPITFQVIDPVTNPAFISNISGVGTGGSSSSTTTGPATATLNMGANKTNRTLTVNANVIPAGTTTPIVASLTVSVVGTVIALPSGSTKMVFGATLPFTTTVKDSANNGIAGQLLTFHSSAGNQISPATATTDINGSVSFTVTGTVSGNDTITVTGLGATSQPLAISVSNSNFLFTSPAANTLVPINSNQPLTLHWDVGGVAQVNKTVQFTSTRGNLSALSANTDGNGNVAVAITSPGTGISTITATGPNGSPLAILNVVFVTSTASKVSVQAGSASIPINTFDSNGVARKTSSTTIQAIVRDVNNNLVQGATVNFQIVTDPSGGSLDSASSVTNISGATTINYIAGTTSSGTNTVQISATVVSVNGVPVNGVVQAFVNLTVTGQALFIRMQTDNKILSATGIYTKQYFALVTDSGGNPVSPPVSVTFSVAPTNFMSGTQGTAYGLTQCEAPGPTGSPCAGAYEKGQWVPCTAVDTPATGCLANQWQKVPEGVTLSGFIYHYYDCLNEDTNFNGILDAGEDYNGNSKLDPGNVASVNINSMTDATTGVATANVTYVQGFATWASVKLTATITVAGTEYIQSIPFVLPILAGDVGPGSTTGPPGTVSPFGIQVCNKPN